MSAGSAAVEAELHEEASSGLLAALKKACNCACTAAQDRILRVHLLAGEGPSEAEPAGGITAAKPNVLLLPGLLLLLLPRLLSTPAAGESMPPNCQGGWRYMVARLQPKPEPRPRAP